MFNEQIEEFSNKQGKKIPVWQSPKYIESRKKAKEIIDSGKYGLEESDFWILMNETKSGKMAYTGLIISHNGCLKVNDGLDNKFRPECVSINENGWGNSLVYTYRSAEQGLYEVGEVSSKNCKIDYPYAMALKRMFDRVVLKLSKLAYAGIYGEDEADEFRNPLNETETNATSNKSKPKADKQKQEEKQTESKETTDKKQLQDRLAEKVKSLVKTDGTTEYAICENCGNYIYAVDGKDGKTISVPSFCEMGLKRFGKAVCKNCFAELNEKKNAAK